MQQIHNPLYTAKVRTTGGRSGSSRSADGRLDIKHSPPGGPGNGTNPEQLFAAGWSACFQSALAYAARKRNVLLPEDTVIDAEVDLCTQDGAYFLQARLNVSFPGVDATIAQALLEDAHATCPYSKAIRGNIATEIRLV